MLTHFGTLFAMWHIYHYLTFCFLYNCFTWNTTGDTNVSYGTKLNNVKSNKV